MNLYEMSELLGCIFKGENKPVSHLAYDSREVEAGSVFLPFEVKTKMVINILKKPFKKEPLPLLVKKI